MNKRIILGLVFASLLIGATAGAYIGCAYSLRDAKTPLGWCIEEIKERNLFEENDIHEYAYTYKEVVVKADTSFDKSYLVDFIFGDDYGEYLETWFCGVNYKNSLFKYIKKNQIIDIECDRIKREDL